MPYPPPPATAVAFAASEADAALKRDSVYVLVPEACDVRVLERGVRNGRVLFEEPMPRLVWARLARSAIYSISPPVPETPPSPKEAPKEALKEKERECAPTKTSLSEASISRESTAAAVTTTTTTLGEQLSSQTHNQNQTQNQNQSQNVPAPVAITACVWRGWPDQLAMFYEEFRRMGFDEKHWQVYENVNYRCVERRSLPLHFTCIKTRDRIELLYM